MLNQFANQNPKTVTAIKVAACVLGAITAAVVVGVVLNKMGVLQLGAVEEIAETAAETA